MANEERPELAALRARLAATLDAERAEAAERRHQRGYRTARENLDDLIDTGSFTEYGQLAVAAQRNRRDYDELKRQTPGDGVITGTATINDKPVAVVVYDYSVLAGTQGYFHHRKLDRLFELAETSQLPVIMFTEGGGGRPGDTDVSTQIAGLNISSFVTWARLSGRVPRIAINNGFCFAGNAALFGCADITIATRQSWIGMAGPAMIEGGGLGHYAATDIGPAIEQERNGVIDILVADEAEATRVARDLLSMFQGRVDSWQCADQTVLRELIPEDRRWGYPVRQVIETVADSYSFIELRRVFGRPIVTGFMRLEGRPVGVIANDCQQLGGAVDAESADKAARFLKLCDAFGLPIVSFTDTPGFMVGPDSEQQAAVRRMANLFVTGASLTVPLVAIFLRKAYGLGAMAMTAGSFAVPLYAASWPTGEFGAMGLEGSVKLGYKKELEAVPEGPERDALYESLLQRMYEVGKATEAASHLEIDAVIDPADTRDVLLSALQAATDRLPAQHKHRNCVDTW
ncbi:MAG: carboxyl transferase domain-containing protein [Pseudomonadota bacterium]